MKSIIIATAIVGLGAVAQADEMSCAMPEQPRVELEVSEASPKDVHEVYSRVRAFQRELAEYRDCLDGSEVVGKARVKLFNASIDREESVVADFNEVLQAFRARQTNA